MKKRWSDVGGIKIFLVIFLIILLVLGTVYFLFKPGPDVPRNTEPARKRKTPDREDRENIPGINGIVKIKGLSFELVDVNVQKLEPISRLSINPYAMYWHFIVANNGDSIEKVSSCGVMKFEDGSQYRFNLDEGGNDATGKCISAELDPETEIDLYSEFYFYDFSKDSSLSHLSKKGAIDWRDVPGSKITYLSQQEQGLVKYEIDKEDITYTSE
ncbi:hypothetical protein GF386_00795 [Candidatus Pacearchaeota archaeon]|nr:hypothetical protein [Candidatus Pacearchaeota archaeon]MBD3282796.1 hypothetical protein [Candidatus Pacearchaeota archaeon]